MKEIKKLRGLIHFKKSTQEIKEKIRKDEQDDESFII